MTSSYMVGGEVLRWNLVGAMLPFWSFMSPSILIASVATPILSRSSGLELKLHTTQIVIGNTLRGLSKSLFTVACAVVRTMHRTVNQAWETTMVDEV